MKNVGTVKAVRTLVPDESKGGRLVDGAIVGVSKPAFRFQIGNDPRLYASKDEAIAVERQQALHAAIHDALNLDHAASSFTRKDVVSCILANAAKLKSVLQTKRFKDHIKSREISQEKIAPERDWSHLRRPENGSVLKDLRELRNS